MPQMGFSHTAPHFCTPHIIAQVFFVIHHIGRNRFRETRPAAARLELVTGGKERLSRRHTDAPALVEAIANLVAGSISGMKPGAVTVVDQSGQLLSAELGDKAGFGKQSVQQMEYVRKLEQYIRQRASDMLYPMLGTGNFRVQIAADVNFNAVEETQQQLIPTVW